MTTVGGVTAKTGSRGSGSGQKTRESPAAVLTGTDIDWKNVRKVLVVRLRSIGDTVLATPSLIALRRFLPDAQIDIILEDWVAPLLDGFSEVDNVITVSKSSGNRLKLARKIRKEKYDVAFNLHGGTTATFLVRASGARHRVGYSGYSYSFLYNHRLASASAFWQKDVNHSAEQQLALLGFTGVPVEEKPGSRLAITESALALIDDKLNAIFGPRISKLALLHPAAAFSTKQWATENFAEIAGHFNDRGFQVTAVGAKVDRPLLRQLQRDCDFAIGIFDDLPLSEIAALASKADIFVGNDSGIAHISAAVKTPSVVIFGSSNRDHWRPWTDAPNEIVFEPLPCQPCAGYVCQEFDEPKCILSVKTDRVINAIAKLSVEM